MVEEVEDKDVKVVPLRPRYTVENGDDLIDCKKAMQRLIAATFCVVEERGEEETDLSEWEKRERQQEGEDCGPDDVVCIVTKLSCRCQGAAYEVILLDRRVSFRFYKPPTNLVLDCFGLRFRLGDLRYGVYFDPLDDN